MTLNINALDTTNQRTVQWRDSPSRYGRISRVLHWLTAILVMLQFTVVLAWRGTGKNTVTLFLSDIGPHGTLGLMILIVTLVRFIWAWLNRQQRPPKTPSVCGKLARVVHVTFYMILLCLPTLALLRQYGEGYAIQFYGMVLVAEAERDIAWMIAPADLLHSPLSWLLGVLITGHIIMALTHHFWFKDKTLVRMAGRFSGKVSSFDRHD